MDLTNQFLIAMPSLGDSNFSRTVTYICSHSQDGAMGIVINRELELSLGELYQHMQLKPAASAELEQAVMLGGPVETQRGFVVFPPEDGGEPESEGDWDSVIQVKNGLRVATSRDILVAMAAGDGPRQTLVALGYAGWGAGQLESEVLDNAWLSGGANFEIVFDCPIESRWYKAAKAIGVDLNRLSTTAGHS